MLLWFKTSNYRSFRDEATLDMEAAALQDRNECLIPFGATKYLPAVAILGKNGGGKTNLVRAMWLAVQFVCNAQRTQHERTPIPVRPFALNDHSGEEPTCFEFGYVLDGVKYVYGFSATRQTVFTEYLRCWPNGRERLIFSRERQTFAYPKNADRRRKELIAEAVAPNQLFFSVACTMNFQPCIDAMRWFRRSIVFSRGYTDIFDEVIEHKEDREMLDAIENAAKEADVGIDDMRFEFDGHEIDLSEMQKSNKLTEKQHSFIAALQALQQALASDGNEGELRLNEGRIISTTYHKGVTRDDREATYTLNLRDESDGTRRLMSLAPSKTRVLKEGGVWVVDELERELHPMLVDQLIKNFLDKSINVNGAQLIFTTHEISLLDMTVLRRDQVYFTDKDRRTGVSALYSLADFGARKDADVLKAYELGKFGAIPSLSEG